MHASKSYTSAVCIIPPLQLTNAVQRLRCFRDKNFVRWFPHINLLYPFLGDEGEVFQSAADTAAKAVAGIAPFKLKLSSLSYFSHGPRSYTLWLKPDDPTGLQAVQAALQSAFPACDDLSIDPSRGITSFTPHLSVGQWQDKQQLLQDMKVLQDEGMQLEFNVTEVCLISRQGYLDPFSVRYTVPFGSATHTAVSSASAQPQPLNSPYIATIGPYPAASSATSAPSQQQHHHQQAAEQQTVGVSQQTCIAKFGLGASPDGIWNFAYGANMSPQKLGGSRGLHPLESRPGVLRGYKLQFNHRGGFGNLVPTPTAATKAAAAATPQQDSSSSLPVVAAAAAAGQQGANVPCEVHGVLHRVTPADMAALMCMEHEYWPVEVLVEPYARPSTPHPADTEAAARVDPTQTEQTVAATGSSGAAAETASNGSRAEEQQQAQEGHQEQQQQQQPVLAVAFMSPPERCIQSGLPPIKRYLDILVEGATHWQLDQQYTAWLAAHQSIAGEQRGDEYYMAPGGESLPSWPKIRTGSKQGNRRGGHSSRQRKRNKKPSGTDA